MHPSDMFKIALKAAHGEKIVDINGHLVDDTHSISAAEYNNASEWFQKGVLAERERMANLINKSLVDGRKIDLNAIGIGPSSTKQSFSF
jgi:hypothetical protein